ncbi:MAG: cytochrome c maturation protein CcmE [Pseudomonadota bacterium]
MKGLKKQRRIQIIGLAFLCVAGVLTLLWFLPDDAFQFFKSPSELAAEPVPETLVIRLGGLVEEGSLVIGEGESISFSVTDGAASIKVEYTGIRPDLFGEGEGTVATGRYIDGVFQATEILAKHDETYMPKEVIDALKEQGVYQAPDQGS